jgi:hypothetical protein
MKRGYPEAGLLPLHTEKDEARIPKGWILPWYTEKDEARIPRCWTSPIAYRRR